MLEFSLKNKNAVILGDAGVIGEPEDLLGTLIWLVSDMAKFVTGIVVPVDGGFSAYAGV